jgi:hypothetical protein
LLQGPRTGAPRCLKAAVEAGARRFRFSVSRQQVALHEVQMREHPFLAIFGRECKAGGEISQGVTDETNACERFSQQLEIKGQTELSPISANLRISF